MEKSDPELLLLAQDQLRAERRRLSAIQADPVRFYRPHPKQDMFHRAGEQSRRAVFAGNRFGKSHLGAAEDGAWLRGERAWYPESDKARRLGIPQRPVKGLVIANDWDKVQEIWTEESGERRGKIWNALPKGFVVKKGRNSSGALDMLVCKNGSVLRFETVKSFMNNPLGVESSDWDFIHVDEPCPQKMFTAAARGLTDRHGFAWFTLTALAEPWIVDYFSDEQRPRWHIYGTIYDNPTLTKEAIAEFESMLDDDEKQCRLLGIPLHMAGLVYKAFSPDIHVLKSPPSGWRAFNQPPADCSIYVRIDTHPQVPHAVLFCAVDQAGRRFYYDEIFEQLSIPELVREIKQRTNGRNLISVKCEPAAWVLDPITKQTSVARVFAENGLPVQKAVKDLANGILAVKAALRQNPCKIFFAPTLRRTLWEIKRYSWDPKGSNRPIDKDDHMMENLYRCEIDRPLFVEPYSNEYEFYLSETSNRLPMDSLSTADFDDSLAEMTL